MVNVRSFFQNLYKHDVGGMQRWGRMLVIVMRYFNELRHRFASDAVVVRASGMAYSMLLAIVPLVIVFFSIFSALFAEEMKTAVQQWLVTQIMPANPDTLIEYLNKFTSNTKALGVFSSLALLITAVLLFDNIEKNFNALWNVARRRSLLRRFMAFTMVLVWGPVLIALSFYTSGRLRAFLASYNLLDLSLLRFLLGIFPWMISVAAFVLMLYVIPATKVRFRSALIGGVVGGTIWEVAKIGFSHWVARSITYSALYGSLALIPIFLVWLYLTWIIVLLSVEVSYVHQNYKSLVLNRVFAKISPRDRLHLTLRIFTCIAEAFYRGAHPPDADDLADRFVVPLELVEDLLQTLESKGLLVRTEPEEDRVGYLPGRTLANLTLAQVLGAVYQDQEGGDLGNVDQVDSLVRDTLQLGERAAAQVFAERNFLDLLRESNQTATPRD